MLCWWECDLILAVEQRIPQRSINATIRPPLFLSCLLRRHRGHTLCLNNISSERTRLNDQFGMEAVERDGSDPDDNAPLVGAWWQWDVAKFLECWYLRIPTVGTLATNYNPVFLDLTQPWYCPTAMFWPQYLGQLRRPLKWPLNYSSATSWWSWASPIFLMEHE